MKILNVAIILAIIISIALPQPVFADTENESVSGYGSEIQNLSIIGGADYTVLNSDDSGTSFALINIAPTGGISSNTFLMTDFTPAYASITNVTLYTKIYAYTTGLVWHISRIGGTDYLGSQVTVSGTGTTEIYTTYSYSFNNNPATGTAWTTSAINDAEWGFKTNFGSNGCRITYMYLVVTYVAASAPTVTTQAISAITETTATGNGNITSDGGSVITERGFVYDTVSHSSISDNVTPAASGYANSFTDTGTFITGAFDNTIGGLVAGTTYYYRAFAKNTLGYDYGSELTFETLYTPSISISPATAISTTTAQINAIVADDGNQSCDVRFGYGITTQAAVAAYDNQTAWITDVYDIGESAYAELSALNPATTYYFRAEIKNDVGSSESNELNFTTVNAVNEPVSIIAIPYGTSLSLTWVKGSGAPYTLIRYSTGSYPTTTSSGILAYLGTGESVMVEGLTPGVTYYFSAWGKEGTSYSTSYQTQLATTLAYDTGINPIDNIETPPDNDDFLLTPSETNVSNIPLVSGLVEGVSNSYGTPVNMIWYVGWVIVGIGIFVVVYNKFGFKLLMTLVCEIMWFAIGSTLGLTMLWIVVILLIVSAGFMAFGERR